MLKLIQNLSILITLAGFMLFVYYYSKINNKCPPQQVQYKYISRDFETQQENKPLVSNIFSNMFNLSSTWQETTDQKNNIITQ